MKRIKIPSVNLTSIVLAVATISFGLFLIYHFGKVGKEGVPKSTSKPLKKVETKIVAAKVTKAATDATAAVKKAATKVATKVANKSK
jgi:hypothetical protein